MPDHLHVLVGGHSAGAAFRPFMRVFRRRAAWRCREVSNLRLWQRGYYERVLRAHEPNKSVIAYILGNPVRAGLVTDFRSYPYSWAEGWPAPAGLPSRVVERSPS